MRSPLQAAGACLIYLALVAAQRSPAGTIGDASAGKALFEGRGGCARCHTLDRRGGSIGPELSWIGLLRTPESLRRSLIDPDADIHPRFFTVVVETRAGDQFEGLALNEDEVSVQIRDASGETRSFLKANLKGVRREARSLMPSYASSLSEPELDHLTAYLRTLRSLWPTTPGDRTREIAPTSENVEFFNRSERNAEERSDALIDALELRDGARVADLGAGTGYFTWRLAQGLPQWKRGCRRYSADDAAPGGEDRRGTSAAQRRLRAGR